MATSAGADFPWGDEGVPNDAELSNLYVARPLPEYLLAFPSELDGKDDPPPTERLACSKPVELGLLAFPSAENAESSQPVSLSIGIELSALPSEGDAKPSQAALLSSGSDISLFNEHQGVAEELAAQPSILIIERVQWDRELEHRPRSTVEPRALTMPRRQLRMPIQEVATSARDRALWVWLFVDGRCRAWYSTAKHVKEELRQRGRLAIAAFSRLRRETAEAIRHRAFGARRRISTGLAHGRGQARACFAPVHLIVRAFSERIRALRAVARWARAQRYAAYGAVYEVAITLKARCVSFPRRLGPLVQTGLTIGRDIKGAIAIVVCVVALGVSAVVVPMPQTPTIMTMAMRIGATVPARFGAAASTQAPEATAVWPAPPSTSSAVAALTTADPSISSGSVKRPILTASSQLQVVRPAVAPAKDRPDSPRARYVVATNGTDANVPLPLPSIPQQPLPAAEYRGSLAVSSSPEGANVFVNGVVVAATPVVLDDIPVGSRVVRIDMDGHERWSAAVRIVANEVTRVTAKLRPTSSR